MTEFKSAAFAAYEAELERKRNKARELLQLEEARKRAAAMPGNQRFEAPRTPFTYGELRSRVWQAPYANGLTDTWRQHCVAYWARIEQRFGVIMSAPRNAWTLDDVYGPVVGTFAVVLLVVPGERFILPAGERIVH